MDKMLTTEAQRFRYLDGLRGMAALSVALYHFTGHPMLAGAGEHSLGLVRSFCRYGGLGVPVFFVISGFVIAHSIAEWQVTGRFFGNFVLRRVVRLDPPYWFTIAFIICTTALANRLFPLQHRELPSPGNVVAHMFYVYTLLGYEPIESIFWTLVHEVQFYLLFLTLTALMQRLWSSTTPTNWSAIAIVGVPVSLSCTGMFRVQGLCLETWYLFGLGVFVYWWHRGWISAATCTSALVCVTASLWLDFTLYKLAGLATASTFVAASHWNAWSAWLNLGVIQFLGQISYSLYLIHGPVGWRVLSIGEKLTSANVVWHYAWLGAAVLASIVAAWVMRMTIELPSIRLAKRVKRKPNPAPDRIVRCISQASYHLPSDACVVPTSATYSSH